MIQGIGTNYNLGYMPSMSTAPVNTSVYDPSYGYKQMISMRINSLNAKVMSQISSLTQLMNYQGLKPEERDALQKQIDKLKEFLEKIPTIQKILEGKINYPSAEEMTEYESSAKDVIESSAQHVTSLIEKLKKRAEKASQAEPSENSDESSYTPEISEEAKKDFDKKLKNNKSKALDIIQDIYSGSLGNTWGTDYKKIRKGTAKINKDNVADVIIYWEEQFASTKGKSIIKALFDEEHMWNPSLHGKDQNKLNDNNKANNMDMLWNMSVCLKQKAKELDLYNDLAGQFTILFDELDDTFVDQEAVEEAMKTIAATIYQKQAEKLAEDVQKASENKVSKEQKAEEAKKETEAKDLFIADMREIWDDEDLEISGKVKYEDGEFKVRINGEEYTGSSFKALAKAVEDAGYDPRIYLSKQKVDTKA